MSPSPRHGSRLTVLLCAIGFGNTFSIGAFPALLPELARDGLADWQLGFLAGATGLARMGVDVPAGLLVSRNLGRTLVLGLVALAGSVLILGSGGPFPVLVLGRVVMGAAHSLAMLSGLTAILRYHAAATLGIALNAFEVSTIIGMLGGASLLGVLPERWPWNVALLVVCVPQVIGLVLAPMLVRALRGRDDETSVSTPRAASHGDVPTRLAPVVLAFAAGALMAFAYSTSEQFLIPLRGSREFGLDRAGVARLLMTAQACDIVALLPVGMLADRLGASRVLGGVLVVMAVSTALVTFGDLSLLNAGVVCLGLAMTGWMLPLALIRYGTPADRVGWRTALYRVGADGGMFLGPALSGALAGHHAAAVPAVAAVLLVVLAVPLLMRARP